MRFNDPSYREAAESNLHQNDGHPIRECMGPFSW